MHCPAACHHSVFPGHSAACNGALLNRDLHTLGVSENYRRRAVVQADPELRKDFFELERHWLKLARSYELAERLAKFPNPPLPNR
jgi:hypothetical protein